MWPSLVFSLSIFFFSWWTNVSNVEQDPRNEKYFLIFCSNKLTFSKLYFYSMVWYTIVPLFVLLLSFYSIINKLPRSGHFLFFYISQWYLILDWPAIIFFLSTLEQKFEIHWTKKNRTWPTENMEPKENLAKYVNFNDDSCVLEKKIFQCVQWSWNPK